MSNYSSPCKKLLKVSGQAVWIVALAFLCAACSRDSDVDTAEEVAADVVANVDGARIIAASPGDWLSHGRTYSEQRFSPLKQINTENIAELGLAWYHDLDTDRGQEATPIVVDGVMYVSTAWSKVKALNAATGELLWSHDPEVPGRKAVETCCDVVSRGVAVWKGRVYVGSLDGRLIAIDAATGKPDWEVQTTDPQLPYSITGAPRAFNDKVIIGNAGAEFGVRGYVSAYDTETGEMVWRFYTVPGDPSQPFESEAMEVAATTWSGEWWKYGGGGTAWDSMIYDPDLNLVFIGVGNGAPWNRTIRSPDGGDNLYLSSIVAVNADTGEYVWHYQTTPGDTWDFTATQPLMLAELEIGGEERKVIMQAPKNGFFYVLDRENGELLSAEAFATVTWASGIDKETGRPIENEGARYSGPAPSFVIPGPGGAHNWQSMAYSPDTGLVYMPVRDAGFPYFDDQEYQRTRLGFNTGADFNKASMPQDPQIKEQALGGIKASLLAWNPVTQTEAWRVEYPGPSNGGVLATAGNLVVEGTAGGDIIIYRADSGEKLWSHHAQTGVLAAPVSYEVDGVQHVSVVVGWGGIYALAPGEIGLMSGRLGNKSRVLTYRLGGTAALPEASYPAPLVFDPPEATADDETVVRGKYLYHRHCVVCHGDAAVSGGMLSDLRASRALEGDLWNTIVLDGVLEDRGMVSYAAEVDADDSEAIRAYIISRAHESRAFAEAQ